MYRPRKEVISVGFSRSYSEISAWEGDHTFTREALAAQNAEDSTDTRQLATLDINWWPKVLIQPRHFHPKLLCSPGIRQGAQPRTRLPEGCGRRHCSISRQKPVLDPPLSLQLQDHEAGSQCWYVACWSTSGLQPLGEVWTKPKSGASSNLQGSQDRPDICASHHFNVLSHLEIN